MKDIYNAIANLGKKYGADKIILFGSRARGDHRERSDIDIAVYGLPADKQSLFRLDIDELNTLLDFDIVFITSDIAPELLKNIEKDGIELMNKKQEKLEKLNNAVDRLGEALEDYNRVKLDSVRDGVIQRFEFCTELAWKTLREHLIEQGYTDINSPKAVMKTAFADGLLNNEQGWLDILNSRNITSHIYDENTAAQVFSKISTVYYPLFKELLQKL